MFGLMGRAATTSTATPNPLAGWTLTSPTITTPTVTGGTFSAPALTNGSWATPTLTGGSWSGGPTITGPTIASAVINNSQITNPTIDNAKLNAVDDGTFVGPGIAWGANQGFYRPATNVLGIATGNSTQTMTLGIGSGQIGMIQIVQTAASSGLAFYGTQGSFGTPITPNVYPVIQGDAILNMAGGSHAGIRGNAYAVSGTNGFVIGGQFVGYAWSGTWSAGGGPSVSGVIGIQCGAESKSDSSGQHILTGIQNNTRGMRPNDVIHGMEINLATLNSAPSTDPAHRLWIAMGTEAGTYSRRGTDIDAFLLMCRKKLTPDDTTNVRTIRNGIVLGDGGTTVENFPFDSTSTFMIASSTSGTMGGLIDLNNVTVNDGAGTNRGPILKIGSGGADPALDIQSCDDDGGGTLSGWVGVGMTPLRPISVKTAQNSVMYFGGTVANFTTTSVGAAGGATPMPTPLGYLRVNLNGTNVLFAYFNNA